MHSLSPRKTMITAALILTFFLVGCDRQQQAETPPPASESRSFTAAMEEAHSGMMGDVPPGSAKAVVPFAELEVEKAAGENSFTVGELYAQGEALEGQTVRVRGQVVKFSPAIMNRNFIHLQDGSGAEGDRTHNLVVTSQTAVETGAIVTVEGTVAANKDFGAGYTYAVIVEDAQITE